MKIINYFFVLLACALLGFAVYISMTTTFFGSSEKNENLNFLIMGIDSVDFSKHSDTLLLFSYNPVSRTADLLSIPRDTLVFKDIGETRSDKKSYTVGMKINELFAYYYKRSGDFYRAGCDFKSEIEKLFQIPVKNFVILDYQGVRSIIDLAGGVPVRIVKNIDYDDNWGKLHIHFKPGDYVLSGQKSIEYLRYRDDRGDLNRILRQQEFVRSFLGRIRNPFLTAKLPLFLSAVSANIHTDMAFSDIMFGLLETRNISKDSIRYQMLQGVPLKRRSIEFLKVDREKIEEITRIFSDKKTPKDKTAPQGVITAELWNATDRPNYGRRISDLLRRQGIDVLKWGNYGYIEDKTVIYDRVGAFGNASRAGGVLHSTNYVTKLDRTRYVDLTIIIGNDFDPSLIAGIK